MKVSEVIQDADTLIQNRIQLGVKLRWLNQQRRELYRWLPNDGEAYAFETEVDKQIYTIAFPPDTITAVVIGGRTYQRVNQNERHPPKYYWTVIAGSFMIAPVPKAVEDGAIYHTAVPADLTDDDLDKEMDFSADYHQLFVDGLAARLAGANGDLSTSTYYERAKDMTIDAMKRDMALNDEYTIQFGGW